MRPSRGSVGHPRGGAPRSSPGFGANRNLHSNPKGNKLNEPLAVIQPFFERSEKNNVEGMREYKNP